MLLLGGLFSLYHIVLGVYSLDIPGSPYPAVAALALYAIATVLSLWPTSPVHMSGSLAAFNLAVSIALPLLVTSELDPDRHNGYATWYIAAVGTLMTITAARRRLAFAWIGVIALAVQTLLWAGVPALGSLGVVGSIVWVGIAHMLTRALTNAARDAHQFVEAEREAAAWQAAQDAHEFEGRFRLAQTNRIAGPMLRRIIDRGGHLTASQQRECRMLEAAIRDEIRGRMLLTDPVRTAVQCARERGMIVTLLDEGGLDDVGEEERVQILGRLASAIEGSQADRLIARTSANGSPVAVTVVGLRQSIDGASSALGDDASDDEVELWLEIPRELEDAPPLDAR